MRHSETLVYLITGFLDSGKSQFLKFTMQQEYFQIDGKTLIVLCEEGETEFEPELLKETNSILVTVDSQEELNSQWLALMASKYNPERIMIEYNGMWKVSDFENMELPKGLQLVQKITTVDASTFSVYMTNLKPLFVEMVRGSEMVLFNRCTDVKPLAGYRRSVKVVNPGAEVIFEGENGEMENIFEDDVPYELDAPIIQIAPEDYGIWYVDMEENPERYYKKKVQFTAKARKIKKKPGVPDGIIIPGRMAMTCCADDTTFLGYACRYEDADKIKVGQWVEVVAEVSYEKLPFYRQKGPVLNAVSVTPAQEIEELVYFN